MHGARHALVARRPAREVTLRLVRDRLDAEIEQTDVDGTGIGKGEEIAFERVVRPTPISVSLRRAGITSSAHLLTPSTITAGIIETVLC